MKSTATTVADYVASLPDDRRKAISAVRAVIRKHLPKGCVERMQYGLIGYSIPTSRYPKGYLDDPNAPLMYAGLASQKNYMAVYLLNLYVDPKAEKWFIGAYKKSGKKLDMGKSCIRFKKLEDLPLDVIAEALTKTSVDAFIEHYEKAYNKKR